MAARTPQEVAAVLAEWDATVNGRDVPKPVVDFTEAGLPPSFLQSIYAQNFVKPTAIQAVGWPSALSGERCDWLMINSMDPNAILTFDMDSWCRKGVGWGVLLVCAAFSGSEAQMRASKDF